MTSETPIVLIMDDDPSVRETASAADGGSRQARAQRAGHGLASSRPSPVMVLTPLWGDAATTSWPPWRRMATVFEPIRSVPPATVRSGERHPPHGAHAEDRAIARFDRIRWADGLGRA